MQTSCLIVTHSWNSSSTTTEKRWGKLCGHPCLHSMLMLHCQTNLVFSFIAQDQLFMPLICSATTRKQREREQYMYITYKKEFYFVVIYGLVEMHFVTISVIAWEIQGYKTICMYAWALRQWKTKREKNRVIIILRVGWMNSFLFYASLFKCDSFGVALRREGHNQKNWTCILAVMQ